MASKPYATVEMKIAALLRIEEFVEAGVKTSEAVMRVSVTSGIAVRTLYRFRTITKFVSRDRWAEAITPAWNPTKGMKVDCHPEALTTFVDLCRSGQGIAASYRSVAAESLAKGWQPFPPERTLRRELLRHVQPAEMVAARRNAGALGGALSGA